MSTVDAVIRLGRLALAFGRVDRITYHEDGRTLESDTDHTVMLGLVACAFAERHLSDLDLGLIAQYALVHDLVEVYAGDTPTLRISANQRVEKREREECARYRLDVEFGGLLPWVVGTIGAYEDLATAEARYVKALDKLLPKITHILNGGRTFQDVGMDRAELVARYDAQLAELRGYADDFPPLFDLRADLIALVFQAGAA